MTITSLTTTLMTYRHLMADWDRFEHEAPELSAAGRALWEQHGLAYLATVRADGSPRVHPVVPVLVGRGIFVAIADWSPKWRDLQRDPRCVIHALPGPRDDEFVLRCRASEASESLAVVREAAGHVIHDDDHVFGFDIEQADLGWWEHAGQPGTYPVRHRWVPGGLIRLEVGRPQC